MLHGQSQITCNAMVGDNLPAAVNAAVDQQGVAGRLPRRPMAVTPAAQRLVIGQTFKHLPR